MLKIEDKCIECLSRKKEGLLKNIVFKRYGGPRGRVGKVAELQRSFDHLTAVLVQVPAQHWPHVR